MTAFPLTLPLATLVPRAAYCVLRDPVMHESIVVTGRAIQAEAHSSRDFKRLDPDEPLKFDYVRVDCGDPKWVLAVWRDPSRPELNIARDLTPDVPSTIVVTQGEAGKITDITVTERVDEVRRPSIPTPVKTCHCGQTMFSCGKGGCVEMVEHSPPEPKELETRPDTPTTRAEDATADQALAAELAEDDYPFAGAKTGRMVRAEPLPADDANNPMLQRRTTEEITFRPITPPSPELPATMDFLLKHAAHSFADTFHAPP